MVCS